jgi:SDR family mycofactocin-dependent oxidoreductase
LGRLNGKVALVSGAARGQGRSHAIRLAQEGADIVAFDLCEDFSTVDYGMATEADLNETVLAVEALDRRILAEKMDVRDSVGLRRLVESASAAFGRLDIVVANAGILQIAPFTEVSDELWDDVIGTNLTGVFKTVRAALPVILEGGRGGAVVLIASTAGVKGHANTAPYSAAKHGVVALTRVLANEYGRHWIRTNAVLPTTVGTDMVLNQAIYTLMSGGDPNATQAQAVAGFSTLNSLPVPWIEPIDVSNAVVWLASDESRYVNGALIAVDAGCTAK